MIRAAILARVSSEEQVQKYGLSSQVTELRELAAKKAYVVPDGAVFEDDGYSGTTLDRPGLSRLRDAARAGAFEVILIHAPDRLSRKLAHQLLLLDEFTRAGVRVEFLSTPTEDTAESRLLLNMQGVIAEFEREKIRERTTRGKKQKAREGLLPGGPVPFGWVMDPNAPGRLMVAEPTAAVVRTIYRLADEGRSVRGVAAEVGLGRGFVHSVLTNPRYVGRWYYNRRAYTGKGRAFKLRPESEWITVPVPAIVTPELFARAQARLAQNRERLVGRPSTTFLLRGLVKCGECGRRWTGAAWAARRRFEYRCSGRDTLEGTGCRAPRIEASKIEGAIWSAVTEVLRRPGLLAEKFESHRVRLGVREVEIQSEAVHLGAQLERVERDISKLLDVYLTGMALDQLKARLTGLERDRARLRDRLAQAEARAADHAAAEAQQDAVKAFCAQAVRGLDRLDAAGKRRLLGTLIDAVVVLPGGRVEIHGVLPAGPIDPVAKRHRPLGALNNIHRYRLVLDLAL